MLDSLRKKFLVLILIPIVVAFLALSVLSYRTAREVLIDQMEASGLNFLTAATATMEGGFKKTQAMLQLAVETIPIDRMSTSESREVFRRIKKLIGPQANGVFIAFPDGTINWSEDVRLPASYDPRKRPWYKGALALPEGERVGVTDTYYDRRTGGPTFTVYRKVLDEKGELAGVAGVQIEVQELQKKITEEFESLHGGMTFLVNHEAEILVHPKKEMVGLPLDNNREPLDEEIAEAIRRQGEDYLQRVGTRGNSTWYIGFKRVPRSHVFIVVVIPASEILSPLVFLSVQMTAVAVPLIAGLFILMLFMTRRISRPIIDLKESAGRVVAEDGYRDPLPVKSKDEIGQLTESFNEMMEGLRQRDFIRDTFGRYVTQEVVETLLDSPEGLALGGEKREVTILFGDLRGFTPLSESLDAGNVVRILNRYLGTMSDIIAAHHGTVNEFIGDGILALFGAPTASEDSPRRAVACAVDMQLAIEEINTENSAEGLPPLAMGVGINTGEVIVGNIGSDKRAKYGVVGHHINLAARVESATVGGQILITEDTYRHAEEAVIARQRGPMSFKGVEENVGIFDVTGVRLPKERRLPEKGFDGRPLPAPLRMQVHRTKGKQAESRPLSGALTHLSETWVRFVLDAPGAFDEPDIRIDALPPGGAPTSIFAKLTNLPDTSGEPNTFDARISFISGVNPGDLVGISDRENPDPA